MGIENTRTTRQRRPGVKRASKGFLFWSDFHNRTEDSPVLASIRCPTGNG